MAHAEYRVTVPHSQFDVYNFLADGMNAAKWRNAVRSVSHESGPASGIGAVYAQRMTGPGKREIAGDYRITEATPPDWLAFEVIAGPARPRGTYAVQKDGEGTSVLFTLDFRPTGLMRLMDSMIQRTMESEVHQLDNLAQAMPTADG